MVITRYNGTFIYPNLFTTKNATPTSAYTKGHEKRLDDVTLYMYKLYPRNRRASVAYTYRLPVSRGSKIGTRHHNDLTLFLLLHSFIHPSLPSRTKAQRAL